MNAIYDIDLQMTARREQLLAEAESERMASLVRAPARAARVRARVAVALYALADWLSAETTSAGHATSAAAG